MKSKCASGVYLVNPRINSLSQSLCKSDDNMTLGRDFLTDYAGHYLVATTGDGRANLVTSDLLKKYKTTDSIPAVSSNCCLHDD